MKFLIMAIGHCSLDTQACDCHYTWAASCLRSLLNSHEKKSFNEKLSPCSSIYYTKQQRYKYIIREGGVEIEIQIKR